MIRSGRDHLVLKGKRTRNNLEGAGRRERVARYSLDRANGNTLSHGAENPSNHFHFNYIQNGMARTIGANVIDLLWLPAGVGHRKPHGVFQTAKRILRIVIHLRKISGDLEIDPGAPGHGVLQAFDYDDSRAF